MHKAAWHDYGHRRRRVYITMDHANDDLLVFCHKDGRILVCQERGKPLAGERRSLPRVEKVRKRLSMDTSQLVIQRAYGLKILGCGRSKYNVDALPPHSAWHGQRNNSACAGLPANGKDTVNQRGAFAHIEQPPASPVRVALSDRLDIEP